MYRVLLPVDENEKRSLQQAKYVARLTDAATDVETTILTVVRSDELADDGEETFAENGAAVTAADHLEHADVSVQRRAVGGRVSEEIIRVADEMDADELVMGGRKRSGVAQVLLGSTTQDVALSTERPVTITGERTTLGEGPRTVLVPVDASEDRAMDQVEYVAQLPGDHAEMEVTVFTVFRHQDYKGAPPHEFEEVDAAVHAADSLEEEGFTVERVAIGGEVAHEILEAAEEADVDGIVVGGRKRSGVQKVLLGSTVQDVILSAERPVTVTG
jgi:nucleotide-binding universal stress UspA family protein